MKKHYTFTDMRRVVCWLPSAAATLAFLGDNGVEPSVERRAAKRTMRVYDEAGMRRAQELRAQHDAALRIRRPEHAKRIRAIERKPRAERAERETMFTLLKAASTIMVELKALHAKLDALAAQHSSMSFDDKPGAGGTA